MIVVLELPLNQTRIVLSCIFFMQFSDFRAQGLRSIPTPCRIIIALAAIMSMQWHARMYIIRCHSPYNDVPLCTQSDAQ